MAGRKGQITLFIIIGILLIVGFAIYTYISQTQTLDPLKTSQTDALQRQPTELQPIQALITSCLEELGDEAIMKIGQGGGYIDGNDLAYDDSGYKLFNNPISPTDSEGIAFSSSGNIIPYWSFKQGSGGCGDECLYMSKRPALTKTQDPTFSMETQIENYIKKHFSGCVDDFKTFKDNDFDFKETGNIDISVMVNDNDIQVNMKYPIEVTKDDSKYTLLNFNSKHQVNLKQMLDYADDIIEFNENFEFLERNTIYLIGAHSGLDENMLPPTSSSPSDNKKVYWMKSDVKKNIQSLLAQYVPLFQVDSSMNYQEINSPANPNFQTLVRKFVLPLNAKVYLDVDKAQEEDASQADIFRIEYNETAGFKPFDIEFLYFPSWPIYLDLDGPGSMGELLGPETTTSWFPLMPAESTRYKFYYDVSYPIIITIHDPYAMGGKGFDIRFAVEVNLVDNARRFTHFTDKDGNPLAPLATGNTMLCKYDQLNSKEVEIRTYDAYDASPIDDAGIMFNCGENCNLGFTKETTPFKSELKTKFPICVGGELAAFKKGYSTTTMQFDTYSDALLPDKPVKLYMWPDHKLNISMKKYLTKQVKYNDGRVFWEEGDLKKHRWYIDTTAVPFDQYDLAMISFKDKDSKNGFSEFGFSIYNGSTQKSSNELSIHPGNYTFTVTTFHTDKVIIPPRCYATWESLIDGGMVDTQINIDDQTKIDLCKKAEKDEFTCDLYFGGDECKFAESQIFDVFPLGSVTFDVEFKADIYNYMIY